MMCIRDSDKTFLARIRPFISNILIRDGMMDVKSEMIARMTGMLKEENILQSVKLGLWTLELDTVNEMCIRDSPKIIPHRSTSPSPK